MSWGSPGVRLAYLFSSYTHELGSTEIDANSIMHSLNGRFINVVGIDTVFMWRDKVLGHGTHVLSGKAS